MKRSGFTLVELIVCIGVIGLLLAILMPVFSKLRSQARLVLCSSNLRQIAGATQTYASENNGWIPGSDVSDLWWRYLAGSQHLNQPGSYSSYLPFNQTTYSGTVWTCPFVPLELESLVVFPSLSIDTWSNHYGMNRNLTLKAVKITSLRNDLGFIADGLPISLAPPGSPSKPFYFNGLLNSTWTPPFGTNLRFAPWPIDRTGANPGRVNNLHGGYFNIAYVDGHVAQGRTITAAELTP